MTRVENACSSRKRGRITAAAVCAGVCCVGSIASNTADVWIGMLLLPSPCDAFVSRQAPFHHFRSLSSDVWHARRPTFASTCRMVPSSSSDRVAAAAAPFDGNRVMGSDNVTTQGVNWGEEDASDASYQDRVQHQAKVAQLLQQADDDDKQARKRVLWGADLANASSNAELTMLLEQQARVAQELQRRKAALAAASGITLEVLAAPHDDESTLFQDNIDGSIISVPNRNDASAKASSSSGSSWLHNVDQELQEEWEALTGSLSQQTTSSLPPPSSSRVAAAGSNDVDDAWDIHTTHTGKEGVRIGSAGGWTLEVFPGDFVVHRKYGIGRFDGTVLCPKHKLSAAERQKRDARRAELLAAEIQRRKTTVTPNDIQAIRATFGTDADTDMISNPQVTMLEITYADAVVHVPVDRAHRLSRYRAGNAAVQPKLSRVKGDAWRKAKQKVLESTVAMAQDVLALYATREVLTRPPADPGKEADVARFAETFPYTPTPDQLKCFEDVENDMVWRSRPMDRLVCGDVGFGKTEVALRALYRAVANGQQAALLAPTGVLAAQHYKQALQRMGPDTPFNVTVTLLRSVSTRTTAQNKAIRANIANGTSQLIVGTHALLSNDLQFHNLGLLVVDEEQRFGVKQKERLKLIANGIDVLTLSATPIPRTLQMSLSGIRDTSTIRSPPPMRKATITFVQDFAPALVQDAIAREMARGGQCFYVVPRIAQLDEAERLVRELFPDLRIIRAHGRMQGAEDNVAAFAEGDYDVLLATTVIENGVDIPTVNTIIVQNSQVFGMSTLYQLRGRVGRSDLQAYAYFLYREESVTEQAAMRLQAIGELNELGSGFDVASRDLEIRGAGSLLGTEQSGMAAKVGFDLYLRMLKKSIRQMRGLDLPLVPRTNVLLNTDGHVPDTFTIPESLIPDLDERHRQEAKARLAESTAALVDLTNAWKAAYGPLPLTLQKQLKMLHLHACTRRLGIDLVGLVAQHDQQHENTDESNVCDCVLRSPGLRPRHWAAIMEQLPRRSVSSNGLTAIFPPRFTISGDEEAVVGRDTVDLQQLLTDASLDEDGSDWDELDQEETEAMQDVMSALHVHSMHEVDLEQYPRLIIANVDNNKSVVDVLLPVLLPLAKMVFDTQEAQAEQAQAAAELRDKQDKLRKQARKTTKSAASKHKNYYGY